MSQEISDLAKKLEAAGYIEGANEWRSLAQAQLAAGEIPETLALKSEVTRGDVFSTTLLECRVGAYVSLDLLVNALKKMEDDYLFSQYQSAIKNIRSWGKDSLYHLCTPRDLVKVLQEMGFRSISQISDDQTLLITKVPEKVGLQTIQQILIAVSEFESLKQQNAS